MTSVLQNSVAVKSLFSLEYRPMDFNVTMQEKFLDMVSDSTWQLTYKKPSIKGDYP